MKDMAESGIDEVVFRDTEERRERRWISNVFGGERGKGIDLIGNKMNLVLLAKSHVLNHNLSRITSTTLVPRKCGILSERVMWGTKHQNPSFYPLSFGSQ